MDLSKNATVAKIRAVYGKRLKPEDYRELFGKKNVGEAAEYLKKSTHYSQALANIDTAKIHRGFLEDLLRKDNFNRYVRLCKFQQLDSEPFYNYLIVWLEIEEILNVIRHLNADTSDEYIVNLPTFFLHMASYDLLEIAKIRSFKELLGVLKNTRYYNVLKETKTDEAGKVDFTSCETNIRTYYLKWLIETVDENFKGIAKEKLRIQIMTQIDLVNIINVYRMKNVFNADINEIKEITLPYNGRMSMKKQNELFEAETIDDFLRILSRTIYGKQLDNIAECKDSIQFERQLCRLRFNLAKRALLFSENAAVSLYSATYLFDVELENIIKIIEGIRYKKDTTYIESLIVR